MPKGNDKNQITPTADDPDAWARFESAIDTVMKAGPQHRPPKAQKPKPSGEDHQ